MSTTARPLEKSSQPGDIAARMKKTHVWYGACREARTPFCGGATV